MNPPAAIMGSLVDAKNVNAHKCVRLSIDVPSEHAAMVLAAFGWPTMADPIPVAIARLTAEPERQPAAIENPTTTTTYAQQAGIMAQEPAFVRFLSERGLFPAGDDEDAAEAIRQHCGVKSRRDLIRGTPAGNRFRDLQLDYRNWMAGVDA